MEVKPTTRLACELEEGVEVESESVLLSDFAQNFVEQIFLEALEEYQARKRKTVHDKPPTTSSTTNFDLASQSNLTLDKSGELKASSEEPANK